MTGFVGGTPIVTIRRKPRTELERKAQECLLGRTVLNVELHDQQLRLVLDNGNEFTMSTGDEFKEVS